MNQRIHLRVTGMVQGVCYRAYAREKGRELGLTGWVKNLPDGSVELVAEGPEDELEALKRWCSEGSPAARVADVQCRFGDATGEFGGFGVRY